MNNCIWVQVSPQKPKGVSVSGTSPHVRVTGSRSGAKWARLPVSTSKSKSGYWSRSWTESRSTVEAVSTANGTVAKADVATFASLWRKDWEGV